MSEKQLISAAIISFNEINNIERCITSLKGVADEIVVVDSGSTDGTRELALKLDAKVVVNPFEGHIQQKNFAINQCSHNWIISLDCDESLSEELRNSILSIKGSLLNNQVFYFNRFNNYCGKWIKYCGWYPEWKLRMFQKESGAWGGDNPHDEYLFKENYKAGKLKGDLLHYSYYSLEEHDLQMEKFSTIAANTYFVKGRKSNWFKIIFNPIWIFFSSYFLKLGVLDGFAGWQICKRAAKTTYLKYLKLYRLQNG